MKIRQVGAELFTWTDGGMDRPDEANICFPPFLNAPKKRCNKTRDSARGAGLWKFCSLADTDRGHRMLIRSSRPGI
jgi:hypothetical protein